MLLRCLFAFLIGGAICLIGQVLIARTKLTPAVILVSFVIAGAVLTAVGLYEPLVKFSGAGATVPLTGFGYSVIKSTQKAIKECGFLGVFTGGITGTAGGIAASVVFALVASFLSKPKCKELTKKPKKTGSK